MNEIMIALPDWKDVNDEAPDRCGGGHGDLGRCVLPAYHMGDCQANSPRMIGIETMESIVRRHEKRHTSPLRADFVKVTREDDRPVVYYFQGGSVQKGGHGIFFAPNGETFGWAVDDGDVVNFLYAGGVHCVRVVGEKTYESIRAFLVEYHQGLNVDVVQVVPPAEPGGEWFVSSFVEQRGWRNWWIKFSGGEWRFADVEE